MKCVLDFGEREILPEVASVFTKIKGSETVVLKRISEDNFKKIMKFADTYSRMDSKTRDTYNPDKWADTNAKIWYDTEISDLSMPDIIQILNACDELGFEPLSNIGCWHVANVIRGKSPAEMRELLQIPSTSPDALDTDSILWE